MSQLGFAVAGFDNSAINFQDWVTKSLNLSFSVRQTLEQVTNASGFSSWPSCRANEGRSGDYQNDRGDKNGTQRPTLNGAAKGWPTPRAEDSESCGNHPNRGDALNQTASLWATPEASMAKRGDRTAHLLEDPKAGEDLMTQTKYWSIPRADEAAEQKFLRPVPVLSVNGYRLSPTRRFLRPRLNPAFVCWLMGWPWWWTRAEPTNCGVQEMAWWRYKLRSRLECCCHALGI